MRRSAVKAQQPWGGEGGDTNKSQKQRTRHGSTSLRMHAACREHCVRLVARGGGHDDQHRPGQKNAAWKTTTATAVVTSRRGRRGGRLTLSNRAHARVHSQRPLAFALRCQPLQVATHHSVVHAPHRTHAAKAALLHGDSRRRDEDHDNRKAWTPTPNGPVSNSHCVVSRSMQDGITASVAPEPAPVVSRPNVVPTGKSKTA